MSRLRQDLRRIAILWTNGLANLWGDDRLGRALRVATYRLAGNRIGRASKIDGDAYVGGRRLSMGRRSYVNRRAYLDLAGDVTLGDDVVVGHGVTFITSEHEIGPSHRRAGPAAPRPIVVGDGAWIGANSTLLPGVRVGKGAIVAAGSLVNDDVEPDTLVGGVPIRLIRRLP